MSLEKLERPEVIAIERKVDTHFEATPLPTADLNTARWILCTVGEDFHRFVLVEATKTWHQKDSRPKRAQFIARLDQYKYSLRYALDLCAKRLPQTDAKGPVATNSENYTAAAKLLVAAGEYADATRAFSSYHANSTSLYIDRASGLIEPAGDQRISQYGSLEFLLGADKNEFSPILYLVALFSGPRFDMSAIDSVGGWGRTIHEIVNRAKLKKGRIHYQVITNFAKELFDDFNAEPTYPSSTWVFPWAPMKQAQSYFVALQVICVYHLMSIHFGASTQGLEGVGVDQICLGTEMTQLNDDIVRISGLPRDIVGGITSTLTLGNQTDTPDPALQPLVPIGGGRIAVPGFIILSSEWSRNMLSLHARISPKSFDSSSAIFEREMINSIEVEIPTRFSRRLNFHVPTSTGNEELDLILFEESARSILICELRWMLQPGDIREVLNRKKVIREKVAQCRRKLRGARAAIAQVVEKLGLSPAPDWTINGLVIIQGFGGAPSDQPKELPVVPRDVFVRLLEITPNLDQAHAVLCTPLWLPREGEDYIRRSEVQTICEVPFNRPGFEMGSRSYMTMSLPQYLADALQRPVSKLRSTPW